MCWRRRAAFSQARLVELGIRFGAGNATVQVLSDSRPTRRILGVGELGRDILLDRIEAGRTRCGVWLRKHDLRESAGLSIPIASICFSHHRATLIITFL